MRRYPVAVLATVVATSLIAPQAILAEQPSPAPVPAGGATTLAPGSGSENPDASADGSEVAGITPPQRAAEPTMQTSLARQDPRSATASAGPAATVFMKDFEFSPKTVTIDVGESVKWTNKGKAEEGHTATGDNFDSGVLKQGESYTHKFPTAGTFDYICTLHSNMKGTVVVKANSGGGGGGGGGSGSGSGGNGDGQASASGASGSATASPSDPGSTFLGSGGGGSSTASGSGSSGSLPSTGLDLALLALLGVDLLLAGTLGLLRWHSSQTG